ncbi:amino acid-binding protein [Mesorhizobium camelthorni]|uniref:Amino acid-binding protein n=2 Tax=Allomesorhizobium camelthorni TaxID=475069 RepID=A0A6G4WJQ2_9HYPH|nr:glycine betaine ABC transporter substrate-binding protein [Mesorhizobium camelthorni]NGO54991.1 amino acid-binding protein [Mesorhizobium camelthorni]
MAMCGAGFAADLVVGMPNWPSGQASANIIKYAIEKKLGLDVEVREMGTLIIFAGLDSGEVDIHPEVWQPNLDSVVKKYVDERKSVQLSPKKVSATQGLCATRETTEKFGIKDVADLKDPKKTSVLDTDGDGQGEVWIGAETWSSTPIERIRARSYGYAETVKLLEMPEDVGMAAVDAAAATNTPIVFYCYSPHHVFNLHEIVQLTEPEYDQAKWNIVLPADDPANWLTKSNAPVAWAPSHFQIAFATKTGERLPKVASFLSNIDFTPEEITEMSYALEVERQDPAAYAQQWIAAHADRLEAWSK